MSQRNSFFLFSAFILLALGLRLMYIQRPMRLDEANTVVRFASQDFETAISDYRLPNNHILNTVFIHFIYHHWGSHPILVRLPALTAGVLLLAAIYALAKRWYGQRVAWWALAWATISGTLIDFSVNGRGYTLVALFMVLLFYTAQRLLDGGGILALCCLCRFCCLGIFRHSDLCLSDGLRGLVVAYQFALAARLAGFGSFHFGAFPWGSPDGFAL